jgi:hypothetical protein
VPRFASGAPETFVLFSTDGAPGNPNVETRRRLRKLVGPIAMASIWRTNYHAAAFFELRLTRGEPDLGVADH